MSPVQCFGCGLVAQDEIGGNGAEKRSRLNANQRFCLCVIGAWSTTKIPMFLFEISALGAKFAVTPTKRKSNFMKALGNWQLKL